jgi:CBS domain-containing protein
MSTVAKILSKKGPHFNMLEVDTNVIYALAIMKAENSSYVIVTRNGAYAGLFSERDYTQKVVLNGRVAEETPIGDVMTANLPHVSLSGSMIRCMMLMTSYKTIYLPVFEEFDFKGVITMKDLVQDLIETENVFTAKEIELVF